MGAPQALPRAARRLARGRAPLIHSRFEMHSRMRAPGAHSPRRALAHGRLQRVERRPYEKCTRRMVRRPPRPASPTTAARAASLQPQRPHSDMH